jgi:phosphoacetylglucosamine mutase
MGVDSVIEPTGVKYLHKRSRQYDIAVYFESNGHGTILTKDSVMQELKQNNNSLYLFLSLAN